MVGTVIAMPLSGLLCSRGFDEGWSSIFYTYGKCQTPSERTNGRVHCPIVFLSVVSVSGIHPVGGRSAMFRRNLRGERE